MADKETPSPEMGTVENDKPERLHPSYADTPEFAQAVNEAVAKHLEAAVPAILAQLAAANPAAVGSPAVPGTGPEMAWSRGVALAIAELTGQQVGKIFVDPQVLETRKAAAKAMEKSLITLFAQAQAWDGDDDDNPHLPVYKLVGHVFLPMGAEGETLIEPLYRGNDRIVYPMEITWQGVPNLAMAPLNDAAKEVFTHFCQSIGHAVAAEPDPLMALNSHGAVVRGAAAQAILRNERGAREVGEPGRAAEPGPTARLRRRDPPPKQTVRVLGTNAKPVEVS